MNNVIEMSHPLIKHKISLLRDKNTGTNEFRKLIEEIGILMGYEALRDLPLEDVEVETPIYRDPDTFEPIEYYCKLPDPIDQRLIVVLDPMLATGGSAIAAIDFIKAHGGKSIKFMSIIAAPEGVERLAKAHPDVQIYCGNIDRQLNKDAYICPGLGDAGDRIFGTI